MYKDRNDIFDSGKWQYINTLNPLPTLLKWPGGKRSEIKKMFSSDLGLLGVMPHNIDRYYDPFVGGGGVYLSMNATGFFINDKSYELMCFYGMIRSGNKEFFSYVEKIQDHWSFISNKVLGESKLISNYFMSRNEKKLLACVEKVSLSLKEHWGDNKEEYKNTIIDVVIKKIKRIRRVEEKLCQLSNEDFVRNIEGAFKAAFYTFLRSEYNVKKKEEDRECDPIHIALFYFIRENCYSSMFRYNASGEFNVPYGGISYNNKDMTFRFKNWKNSELIARLKDTVIGTMDFEEFLEKYPPKKDDFVFIDPPYDSEFSTYAESVFGHDEHKRLARYLIKKCKAKWMQIVKNTDFIHDLYSDYEKDKVVKIIPFNKTYSVSFRNRNNRKVEHLVIVN